MRENSATNLSELIIDCPICLATGWVRAVSGSVQEGVHSADTLERDIASLSNPAVDELVMACPVCGGRSWVSAVVDSHGDGVTR